jgi:peptidoglycan/LPS O-acetylase OafA/YrhL
VLAVGLRDVSDLLLYHGTLERADALLYGCAAAAAVRTGWRPPAWLPWPCLLALAGVVLLHGTVAVTAGLALLGVAAAGLVVGLDHAPGRLRAVLGSRPLAVVGMLSYGIYLWHYPLMRMADRAGGPWAAAVAGLLVTPLVAAASYYLLERPVRSWVRSRRPAASSPLDEAAGEGGFAGASEPR